ncbi:MAG: M23 family metallopeptidase [Bacteroidales bacterium]|nr:M23 family metallopeptidase [Tenuifilaceae bacterium]
MQKHKYKFNSESLSFVKEESSLRLRVWRGVKYLFFSIVVSVAYYVIFSFFFDTPQERGLRRDNDEMLLQLELFNKKFDHLSSVLADVQQRDDNIYRTIFEAEPIPNTIREAGIGGVDRYSDLEGLPNSEIVIRTAKRIDKLSKQIYIQSKSFDEVIGMAKRKEEMIASIPAIQPISNKDLRRVASPFGVRMHPFYKVLKMHNGMDFTSPTGTEIYATGDGVVSDVIHSSRGYGNTVIIDHGFGYKTLYAHQSQIIARRGQKVKRGEVIGLVGNTGMSMAPHLHYEVRRHDQPINPINFYFNDLTPDQYDKIIELASQSGQSLD